MYCRGCGTALLEDALFCSKCGAARNAVAIERSGRRTRRRARGRGGPYVLAACSPTRRHVRLALLGFVFPPLWSPITWDQPWSRELRMALIAAMVVLNEIWIAHLTGSVTPVVGTLVFTILLGMVWLSCMNRAVPADDSADLRRVIESKLDTCHEIIAQVEADLVPDLLPAQAPAQQRYRHALEMRAEGMELFERAQNRPDLVAADDRVTHALDALRAARDDLSHSLSIERGDA